MFRNILPTVLDTKCRNILSQERFLARSVAEEIIGTSIVGVWDFLIPVFFLTNLMKNKRAKEVFILNYLFTKNLAVEAAKLSAIKTVDKPEALTLAEIKTENILLSDKKGLYSNRIRQAQLKEIALLFDHYQFLISTEAKEYNLMVKLAYPSRESLEDFYIQLTRIEIEVNKAALQQFDEKAQALDFVSNMEKSLESWRGSQLNIIYPPL